MNFEQSMREELIQISNLNQKVFPLSAPEGTKTPFVVYRKASINFAKTLSGMSNKAEAVYDLSVLESDYAQLQQITDAIKDKAMSFFQRPIGSNGPLIQDVTVAFMGDQYEPDVNWFLSTMRLTVKF